MFRFCFCSGKEDPKDAPRELGGISFFFFSGILVLFSRKKEDPKDKGPGPGLGVLLIAPVPVLVVVVVVVELEFGLLMLDARRCIIL